MHVMHPEMCHVTLTMPIWGLFVAGKLGLAMINLWDIFEARSSFTHLIIDLESNASTTYHFPNVSRIFLYLFRNELLGINGIVFFTGLMSPVTQPWIFKHYREHRSLMLSISLALSCLCQSLTADGVTSLCLYVISRFTWSMSVNCVIVCVCVTGSPRRGWHVAEVWPAVVRVSAWSRQSRRISS